jgi:hypothetical protein
MVPKRPIVAAKWRIYLARLRLVKKYKKLNITKSTTQMWWTVNGILYANCIVHPLSSSTTEDVVMDKKTNAPTTRRWTTLRDEKNRRLEAVVRYAKGKILNSNDIVAALETVILSGDRVALEGDNQKQADFLSRSLVQVDPG